jgi:glycosyltransferase involved in cell wall biosynthesis
MSQQRRRISKVGIVAIGRNEGERLRKCLQSVIECAALVVYVDSGSTDNSVAMARGIGSDVIELDMRVPFTAARARNIGFEQMRS